MLHPTLVVQRVESYMMSKVINPSHKDAWTNTLSIPFYFACLSLLVLVVQGILTAFRRLLSRPSRLSNGPGQEVPTELPTIRGLAEYTTAHGGMPIFVSEILRVVGCTASIGLCVAWFIVSKDHELNANALLCLALVSVSPDFLLLKNADSSFQTYTFVLSLAALISPGRSAMNLHVSAVLTISATVIFVRDVLPLLTYTMSPADHSGLVWALFAVLVLTGVLLPLFTPRVYKPCDPTVRSCFITRYLSG